MTDWQDGMQGSLELIGALFILPSIFKLHKDKLVRGVSWLHVSFFTVWGFWNLYYYPHLEQNLATVGCVLIVSANTFWLGQLIYYGRLERDGRSV